MRIPYCTNCGKKCKDDDKYMCSNKCQIEWEKKQDTCKYCYKKLTKDNKIDDMPYHITCKFKELKEKKEAIKSNIQDYKNGVKSLEKEQKKNNEEIKKILKKYKNELVVDAI